MDPFPQKADAASLVLVGLMATSEEMPSLFSCHHVPRGTTRGLITSIKPSSVPMEMTSGFTTLYSRGRQLSLLELLDFLGWDPLVCFSRWNSKTKALASPFFTC